MIFVLSCVSRKCLFYRLFGASVILAGQDTIGEHLLEVDKAAREREEVILKQLEEKEPLPDKEKDQMAWVRAANQHRAIAEEIILKELIYV